MIYGIAIDTNPVYNPYEQMPGKAYPANSQRYLNRSLRHIGMIHVNGPVFHAFISHGWTWGAFADKPDYMHFRKVITPHYRVHKMQYIPKNQRIKGLPAF